MEAVSASGILKVMVSRDHPETDGSDFQRGAAIFKQDRSRYFRSAKT
jgi:hypothetical protein